MAIPDPSPSIVTTANRPSTLIFTSFTWIAGTETESTSTGRSGSDTSHE
jgi:hypothetical protein